MAEAVREAGAIQSLFFQVARDETEILAGRGLRPTNMRGATATWQGRFISPFGADACRTASRRKPDRDARQRLTMLIDSAFETMDGLQGWIARWDWIPRFTMAEENNYTPYEDAYAIG